MDDADEISCMTAMERTLWRRIIWRIPDLFPNPIVLRAERMYVSVFGTIQERRPMRLRLLFIVMDVLTVLAYPIVLAQTKISQFSKSMASISLVHSLLAAPVTEGE